MEQPGRVHEDQLALEVPASPDAIGTWTPEEQFKAYAEMFGEAKAEEQRNLADLSRKCTCGAEDKERYEAQEQERKVRSLRGYQHGAGCPKSRTLALAPRGLAPDAQRELYEAQKNRRPSNVIPIR